MIIPVKAVGDSGLILDFANYDLPPNVASNGANIQFNEGRVEKTKGWQSYYSTTLPNYDYLLPWVNEVQNSHVIVDSAEIYRKNAVEDAVISVTPSGGFTASDYWQHTYSGNIVILNNGSDIPFAIRPNDATFAPFSVWNPQDQPDGDPLPPPVDRYDWRADEIQAFAGFLVATGISKDGQSFPFVVKWSDVLSEDIVAFPPSWDEGDPTTLAGENPLSSSAGEIVTQRELNGANIIYTQGAVFVQTYVGGQFVFNFRQAFNDDGCYNKNCVVEFFNKHLVVGFNSIYVHDGNTKTQIAEGTVQDTFYEDLGDRNSIFVTNDANNRRILIHYNSKNRTAQQFAGALTNRGGNPFNSVLIYSYKNNTWTFQALPFESTQCRILPRLPENVGTWDDLTEPTWLDWSVDSWSSLGFIDGENMLAYEYAPDVLEADVGLTFNGEPYISFFEIGKLDFDQYFKATYPILFLSNMWIQAQGTGTLTVQVAATQTPAQVANWNDAEELEFNLGDDENSIGDYVLNLRRTGRYLSFRFSMVSNGAFSLSGYDLDIETDGDR